MVVIRLARRGARRKPSYSLVAADSRNKRDGRFIEKVGFYNPLANSNTSARMNISMHRIQHWIARGARLSPTVKRLIKELKKNQLISNLT